MSRYTPEQLAEQKRLMSENKKHWEAIAAHGASDQRSVSRVLLACYPQFCEAIADEIDANPDPDFALNTCVTVLANMLSITVRVACDGDSLRDQVETSRAMQRAIGDISVKLILTNPRNRHDPDSQAEKGN